MEYIRRLDHQVKIRGFRIELGEIEGVLNEHPECRDVVVLARDDVPGGTGLIAYLVCSEPQGDRGEFWRAYLVKRLPEYMVPLHYVEIAAFPLTANGKIDRKALPLPIGGAPGAAVLEI